MSLKDLESAVDKTIKKECDKKKHKDVTIIGVSVWENDQDAVEPFVKDTMGDKMDYSVALDAVPAKGDPNDGAMAKNWMAAAEAIMTTDTVPKAVSRRATIGGRTVTVTGICKGAGMIRPNMATMLGFVATDNEGLESLSCATLVRVRAPGSEPLRVERAALGGELVDEAVLQTLLGVEDAAGLDHHEGGREARDARQEPRDPAIRAEPEPHHGRAHARARVGESPITREGEREPGAHRGTVDRRDDRLVQLHVAEHGLGAVDLLLGDAGRHEDAAEHEVLHREALRLARRDVAPGLRGGNRAEELQRRQHVHDRHLLVRHRQLRPHNR